MSTNIDLYSYFPGLSVTQDDLLQSEIFARQLISTQFPDTDLREGTALSDLVIRPSATLLALINKALTFYFSQNTLSGVTDTTPTAFVDKLLSNWFMNRIQGINSIINARLYFAKTKSISLLTNTYFSPDGILKYFPISDQSFASTNLTLDSSQNEWYIDVDLVAEQSSVNYDISSGSLLYFLNFDPYFLHAEVNYLVSPAQLEESNTQFISRTKSAISTRNLINTPSIVSNLTENFGGLVDVVSRGFGDTPMIRDKKLVLTEELPETPIWIHLGGMVDVYCRTQLTSSIIQLTTDTLGDIYFSGPIYKLERSSVTGGAELDVIPNNAPFTIKSLALQDISVLDGNLTSGFVGTATLTLPNHGLENGERITISGAFPDRYNGTHKVTIVDKDTLTFTTLARSVLASPATGTVTCTYVKRYDDVGFSNRHQFKVSFGGSYPGETASFIMYYFQNIDGIDTYLTDPLNRVICADLLARGFNITFLDVSIVSYNIVLPSSDTCATLVKTYLTGLTPGQPFIMSDLLAELYTGGVTTIRTPLDITFSKSCNDMQTNITGVITDVLDPLDPLNVFALNSLTINSSTIEQAITVGVGKRILALPLNGTDGSITFLDLDGHMVLKTGNVSISGAQSKFGGGSAYFGGSGSWLSVTPTSDFAFGTDDFTIGFWMMKDISDIPATVAIMDNYDGTNSHWGIAVTTDHIAWETSVVNIYPTTASAFDGNWHYIEIDRSGTDLYAFMDGIQLGDPQTDTRNYIADGLNIGAKALIRNSAYDYVGWLDEISVVKGIAVHTSDFAPPTTGLTSTITSGSSGVSSTVVLGLHFDGTADSTFFSDTAGHILTPLGTTKISTLQSKFGGSSAYFDGLGSWLQVTPTADFAFGTDDFTIEFWILKDTSGGSSTVAIFDNYNATSSHWGILVSPTNIGWYTSVATLFNTPVSAVNGTWHHIEIARSNNLLYAFLDGILLGPPQTNTENYVSDSLYIGAEVLQRNPIYDFRGWLDDMRITKGVALHTTSFGLSTSPFPD